MTDVPVRVHWTQFPATALTDRNGLPVNWKDHRSAHRAVSRLFPSRLPGNEETRRATAGILYRIDRLRYEPRVLVQSTTAPELVPAGQGTRVLSAHAWELEAGAQIIFRVAVNPVLRTTRHYLDAEKTIPTAWSNQSGNQGMVHEPSPRKQTARVVPVSDMAAWLTSKLGVALAEVQMLDHRRNRTGAGKHRLVVDTIDGLATVHDPSEFDRLRLNGVGRSKSYGCGLLTAARHNSAR